MSCKGKTSWTFFPSLVIKLRVEVIFLCYENSANVTNAQQKGVGMTRDNTCLCKKSKNNLHVVLRLFKPTLSKYKAESLQLIFP